jgi:hypothetical protein
MLFKVTVTYEIHDGTMMTKELPDIEKVARVWEKINNEPTELLRVYRTNWKWWDWAAGAVRSINLMPQN